MERVPWHKALFDRALARVQKSHVLFSLAENPLRQHDNPRRDKNGVRGLVRGGKSLPELLVPRKPERRRRRAGLARLQGGRVHRDYPAAAELCDRMPAPPPPAYAYLPRS